MKVIRCSGDPKKVKRCSAEPKKARRCTTITECESCQDRRSQTPIRLIMIISGQRNCGCSDDGDNNSRRAISGSPNGTYRLEQVPGDPCLYRAREEDIHPLVVNRYFESTGCGGGVDEQYTIDFRPEVRIALFNRKINITSPCSVFKSFQFDRCEAIDIACDFDSCGTDRLHRDLFADGSCTVTPVFA